MPRKPRLETERVFPSFFIDIVRHVNVPGPPGPFPGGIGHLGVGDVYGRILEGGGLPRAWVEVEEGGGGVEGHAKEEPAALVLVDDVDDGVMILAFLRGIGPCCSLLVQSANKATGVLSCNWRWRRLFFAMLAGGYIGLFKFPSSLILVFLPFRVFPFGQFFS